MLKPVFPWLGVAAGKTNYVALPLAFGTITVLHITAGEPFAKTLAIRNSRPSSCLVSLQLAVFSQVLPRVPMGSRYFQHSDFAPTWDLDALRTRKLDG